MSAVARYAECCIRHFEAGEPRRAMNLLRTLDDR